MIKSNRIQALPIGITPSGVTAPPVVTAETVDFGAKTLINSGDYALTASGSPTSWNITGGSASSQYNIDNNGVLTSAVANPTGGTLTVTATNAAGTSPAETITINSIANAYSVAPSTSETQLEQATEAAGLALGDSVLLRSGNYNQAQADRRTKRTAAPTGTWGGSNYVVVTKHTGATPVIWRWVVDASGGSGAYFNFYQLDFEGKNDGVHSGSAAGLIMFINSCNDCSVEECDFTAPDVTPSTVNLANHVYIAGASSSGMVVKNNTMHSAYDGISIIGPNSVVEGNIATSIWNDCVKASDPFNDSSISWNTFYDKKYGDGGLHGDFIQGNFSGATAGTLDNITVGGNLLFRGNGTSGQQDGQGIFMSDHAVDMDNFTCEGNMYVGTFANGILANQLTNSTIRNNVALMDGANATVSSKTQIWTSDSVSNTVVENNIANDYNNGSGTTATNNITEALNTLVAYQAYFDNPKFGGDTASRAAFIANYSIKSGSAPDLADPKQGAAGTGYIDYTLETINIPSGFTMNYVSFDGTNDYINSSTTPAGPDSSQMDFHAMITPAVGIAGTTRLYDCGGRHYISLVNEEITVLVKDNLNVTLGTITTSGAGITDGNTHSVYVNIDTSAGAVEIRVNGSADLGGSITAGNPLDLTRGTGLMALSGGTQKFEGDVGRVYYEGGAARGEAAYYSGGVPVDISAFGSSGYTWFGDGQTATNWNAGTNQGTETVFQMNGAVTDA